MRLLGAGNGGPALGAANEREAHGGRIDALTRDSGGALFRIVLPTPMPLMSLIRSQEDPAA